MGTTGPLGSFSEIKKSQFDHWRAWQTNSDDHLFVIGSMQHKSIIGNKKTEIYDVEAETWTSLPDYPTTGTAIHLTLDNIKLQFSLRALLYQLVKVSCFWAIFPFIMSRPFMCSEVL